MASGAQFEPPKSRMDSLFRFRCVLDTEWLSRTSENRTGARVTPNNQERELEEGATSAAREKTNVVCEEGPETL